ncbi:CMD domain-containing protein [Microvirga lotononidis]|uniref:CMD domain protein, Avi_7170 family n=1 Tax=Microvirga lotononidis TaxID=864069 RepID=I4Z1B9_9HYPH|nr:hypothetical protein [Microvirga lotononidis]EIM30011.1 hypothetical protein MicloDRAFT_00013320 [Microvirga lotononidis]WQO31939.1 hypothetical protein U0023_31875 [Microvirga lotononidis]
MDQIDVLSGLTPESELYHIRRERPEYVEGTEACRETVLSPNHGFDLSHVLRAALAARMARFIGRADLAHSYTRSLNEQSNSQALSAVASGAELPVDTDDFLLAIVRHVDLVTKTPRDSTRDDIERLKAAGLSNPQIIALSELIAFVNFEARVIVALEMLEQVA